MSKQYEYKFSVSTAEEFDLARVINEAPPNTPIIVISSRIGSGILAISKKYLAEFNNISGVFVHSNELCSAWGRDIIYARAFQNSLRFSQWNGPRNGIKQSHPDYRLSIIDMGNLPTIKSDLKYAEYCLTTPRSIVVRYL